MTNKQARPEALLMALGIVPTLPAHYCLLRKKQQLDHNVVPKGKQGESLCPYYKSGCSEDICLARTSR